MQDFSEIDRIAERLICEYRSRRNEEIRALAEAVEAESNERFDCTVEDDLPSQPPSHFVLCNPRGEFLAGWIRGRAVWCNHIDNAEVFHANHARLKEASLLDAVSLPAPWWRIGG